MSDNEKKLLTLFSIAGFVILNFLGFNYAVTLRAKVDRDLAESKAKLAQAEMIQANSDEIADEIQWLADNEPEPKADQDVQTALQQFAEREARACGLVIKTQNPLPTDATEGRSYHRAKFQFVVTGLDEAVYQWFDRLNDPTKFRVASNVRWSPNTQNDTQLDCSVTVEQWFVPPAL